MIACFCEWFVVYRTHQCLALANCLCLYYWVRLFFHSQLQGVNNTVATKFILKHINVFALGRVFFTMPFVARAKADCFLLYWSIYNLWQYSKIQDLSVLATIIVSYLYSVSTGLTIYAVLPLVGSACANGLIDYHILSLRINGEMQYLLVLALVFIRLNDFVLTGLCQDHTFPLVVSAVAYACALYHIFHLIKDCQVKGCHCTALVELVGIGTGCCQYLVVPLYLTTVAQGYVLSS